MVWYPYKSKHIVQNWNSNLTFSELHLFIYIYIYIYIIDTEKLANVVHISKICTIFTIFLHMCTIFATFCVSIMQAYFASTI